MLFNFRKFDKEAEALRGLQGTEKLQPLRKETLKEALMSRIEAGNFAETKSETGRYIVRERRIYMFRFIGSTLIGIAMIGGTAFASTAAKPGDAFFPVKKAVQQTQLKLTTNEQSKAELHAKIAEDRLNDIEEVQDDDKDTAKIEAETEVKGAIDDLTEVQSKLEAKGNTQAASSVSTNIARLKAHAEEHSVTVRSSEKAEVKTDTESEDKTEMNKTEIRGGVDTRIRIEDKNAKDQD